MIITIENIIDFLDDEGIGNPRKTKIYDELDWKIMINEPWENDTKMRCGIISKNENGKQKIFFNSFKAVAIISDEYKGDFYKFVKIIKNFSSIKEAKFYFLKKYVLKNNINELKNIITDTTFSYSDKEYDIENKTTSINFPEHFRKINKKDIKYIKYLLKRGLSIQDIKKHKIFIDEKQERIIFPTYYNGILEFWSGRSIKDNIVLPWLHSESFKNIEVLPIWNLDNVNGNTISLFEGIFDAIQVYNGVALIGAKWNKILRDKILNKKYVRINIIMDNDIAGKKIKLKIAQDLIKYHNNVYIYNYKGISEKDFGTMKEKNIDFELEKRLIHYTFKTHIQLLTRIIE